MKLRNEVDELKGRQLVIDDVVKKTEDDVSSVMDTDLTIEDGVTHSKRKRACDGQRNTNTPSAKVNFKRADAGSVKALNSAPRNLLLQTHTTVQNQVSQQVQKQVQKSEQPRVSYSKCLMSNINNNDGFQPAGGKKLRPRPKSVKGTSTDSNSASFKTVERRFHYCISGLHPDT